MLVQQPPATTLGIWKVDMGCSFEQGFQNTTESLSFADEGGIRMGRLIEYTSRLERGYTWNTLWEEEGNKRLEREKDSLFFRKGSEAERRSLLELWRGSDMVIKLTRWS